MGGVRMNRKELAQLQDKCLVATVTTEGSVTYKYKTEFGDVVEIQVPKKGRPKSPHKGKDIKLYLDNATVINAQEIGEGSISKGVRLAVETYKFFNCSPHKNLNFADISQHIIKRLESVKHD
jgi:hypothetical protein